MRAPADSGRPIGVGVIGTGFGRSTQIPAFLATPGMRVLAVASARRVRAEETARAFQIPHAFAAEELEAFLAVPGLDLVCVTSPPATHRPYTLAAFAAGKHVLCEKPTALDADEARAMADAWQRSGRLGLVDHELRFDAARGKLKQLVRDGFLGRLHHVALQVETPSRLDPERPTWSWWSDRAQGGGFLGALGSHVVDAVRYTFGEIVATRAHLETFVRARRDPESGAARLVTADDYAALWLRLEDGGLVNALLSAASRSDAPGWRIAAHGERASLLLDAGGRLSALAAGKCEPIPVEEAGPAFDARALRMADTPWSRAFLRLAGAIREALAAGSTVVREAATLDDGLRSQEVLDAARLSAEEERWVACGPRQGAASR
jgi:predicted dehydrogenase